MIEKENHPLSSKLRVAWFSDIFDEVSGVITDTIELYEKAKQKGFVWLPITAYPKSLYPFYVFRPIAAIDSSSYYEGTQIYLPNFIRIIRYLRENKINMIVSNTPAALGLAAIVSSAYLKIPMVDIYHTDVDYYTKNLNESIIAPYINKFAMAFVKQYQKQADLIFVRTKDYYNLMIEAGHPAEKLRMYPAGVNADVFHPKHKNRDFWKSYGVDPSKKILLFVGRITRVKDIGFIIKGIKALKPDVEVVIVGSGPDIHYYEKMAKGMGNIHFAGILRGNELQTAYASADFFLCPSASETLGKTVLEAMASGLPVLVSDKGGPKDYVEEGKNGFLFQAQNQQDFNKKLALLLQHSQNWPDMGKAARESILPYSLENLFNGFVQNLAELL
ncbi:MAG: glycosyltransferase family 1 protein [Candidatus Hydrogenedentota bacterium]|nr:MAG: glycosyltransferase family 1 protein [Candidatus Hydrogenedentota bacterium]